MEPCRSSRKFAKLVEAYKARQSRTGGAARAGKPGGADGRRGKRKCVAETLNSWTLRKNEGHVEEGKLKNTSSECQC